MIISDPSQAVTKTYGKDFHSEGGALTLKPSDLVTHPDGWTITGEVHEDYYEWVNEFEATHPVYGRVWGDFEAQVFADSQEAFDHFYISHQPEAWDYGDI